MTLLSAREAARRLESVGVGRRRTRQLLQCGVAGQPQRRAARSSMTPTASRHFARGRRCPSTTSTRSAPEGRSWRGGVCQLPARPCVAARARVGRRLGRCRALDGHPARGRRIAQVGVLPVVRAAVCGFGPAHGSGRRRWSGPTKDSDPRSRGGTLAASASRVVRVSCAERRVLAPGGKTWMASRGSARRRPARGEISRPGELAHHCTRHEAEPLVDPTIPRSRRR